MNLADPVTTLPGVGDSYTKRLAKLKIRTLFDLINHFPSRYLDYSQCTPIAKATKITERSSHLFCIKAKLISITSVRLRSRLTLQKAIIEDATGTLPVTWFNQPYLKTNLKTGQEYYFTGELELYRGRPSLTSPDAIPSAVVESPHSGRLVPVYPLTAGITSKWLRHKIHLILKNTAITEVLPASALASLRLLDLNTAYSHIHFPMNYKTNKQSKTRLAFNDLLTLHLKSQLTRKDFQSHTAPHIAINPSLHQKLLNGLSFKLTADQEQAIGEIFADLEQPYPMNRLLQGDVGSGKTIAALAAALQVAPTHQVVIMAPTQILAEQHFNTFTRYLKPFGIKPGLVTATSRRQVSPILIGTHALLHDQKLISQKKLGLLIIDEQHRFGVLQRTHFHTQKQMPHILTMSATPIPRTLALSLFGHLDLSRLASLPSGRQPVKTWVVPQTKRTAAYDWIKEEILKNKSQAFIVCPLIESSDHESLKDVKAVTQEFDRLKQVFSELKLGLLHGRMKPKGKNQVLADFKSLKSDILVTTPVIEVGIDIPNAAVIVIEGGERFGLAQLHQLRGRVGRGQAQSYCLIFTTDENPDNLSRLKLMEKYHDGLKLARLDLKLRGSGEIFGLAQSGYLDTQFPQFWSPTLSRQAKTLAQKLVETDATQAKSILDQLNPQLSRLLPILD